MSVVGWVVGLVLLFVVTFDCGRMLRGAWTGGGLLTRPRSPEHLAEQWQTGTWQAVRLTVYAFLLGLRVVVLALATLTAAYALVAWRTRVLADRVRELERAAASGGW